MNITLILGPLTFLTILYPSVQVPTPMPGELWSLRVKEAKIGNRTYFNHVVLEKKEDDKTWYIYAIPPESSSNFPEVVYGPFELRGFGPYSMLIVKVWLNTTGGERHVAVHFPSERTAWQFYLLSNPHHSSKFLNDFMIKRLEILSQEGQPQGDFEENVPKAFDIFSLETETGEDSRARIYIVHNTRGYQKPILMFHSTECEMTVDGGSIMLSISPLHYPRRYRFRIEFEDPSFAQKLHDAYTTLKVLGFNDDLHELEALPKNTYPTLPYGEGASSSTGQNQSREN